MKNSELSIGGFVNLEGFLRTKRDIHVSTLARIGNPELVERFLTEKISFNHLNAEESLNNQLYMACFWGDKEAVKALITMHANVNHANPNTMWTPLHAATFNEHGLIVMILLEFKADPMSLDYKGRTPLDFASASDIIWPHFAFFGYQKTPRQALIDLEILEVRTSSNTNRTNYQQHSSVCGPPNGDILGQFDE